MASGGRPSGADVERCPHIEHRPSSSCAGRLLTGLDVLAGSGALGGRELLAHPLADVAGEGAAELTTRPVSRQKCGR